MNNTDLLKTICGCCAGTEVQTPLLVDNRPGLSAVEYRIGTHCEFLHSMQARLSAADYKILRNLLTRDQDDFTIALLDAWAVASDILTFYQERLANEAYLATAQERFSLIELAKLIGYRINPGVSASTYIAFSMERMPAGPSMPTTALIEAGTRLQSTPGQDELPQVFETTQAITARLEWNAIQPMQTQTQQISTSMTSIILDGITHRISAGDRMLIKKSSALSSKRVRHVNEFPDEGYTRVDFSNPVLSPSSFTRPTYPAKETVQDFIDAHGSSLSLSQCTVDILLSGQWRNQDLTTLSEMQQWDLQSLQDLINETTTAAAADDGGEVHVFRKITPLFGYNAPKLVTYDSDSIPNTADKWTDWTTQSAESASVVYLDGEHKECQSGGYIYLHAEGSSSSVSHVYEINSVTVAPRTAYGVSNKTTRLGLKTPWWSPQNSNFIDALRGSQAYLANEKLATATVPIEDAVGGDSITLDAAYLFLKAGQYLFVTGVRMDVENTTHTERVQIKDVLLESGRSVLELEDSLAYSYKRDTVTINANVAPANHGETVQEILGSGDGTKTHQRFILKQTPLTYVTAATTTGSASSLQIRVNAVSWQEVDNLYGQAADAHVYAIVNNDDGTSTVQFGDGIHGARLPTGQNNVRAEYRKGLGSAGNLKDAQIDQLLVRPLGVKSAVNPRASTGGADAETLQELRSNAPLTTLTLGRVVSLTDYRDFARSFSGVSKASAVWIFEGGHKQILLTVGGPKGAVIESDSETYTKLLQALHDYGDPYVLLRMQTFRAVSFRLAGNLFVDAVYESDNVLADVKAALLTRFAYDQREFVQPVFLSEVIEVIQGVAGVLAVDVDALHRSDQAQERKNRLLADPPHLDAYGDMLAAEMLTLDPLSLDNLGVLS
jgi:hypothetical protein